MEPGKGVAGVKTTHSRSWDTRGAGNGQWDRSQGTVGREDEDEDDLWPLGRCSPCPAETGDRRRALIGRDVTSPSGCVWRMDWTEQSQERQQAPRPPPRLTRGGEPGLTPLCGWGNAASEPGVAIVLTSGLPAPLIGMLGCYL